MLPCAENINTMLREVIEVLNNIVDFESHTAVLYKEDRDICGVWHYLTGLKNPNEKLINKLQDKEIIIDRVIKSKHPVYLANLRDSENADDERLSSNQSESELWVPLLAGGLFMGILVLGSKNQRAFTKNAQIIVKGVIDLGFAAQGNTVLSTLWEKLRFGILHRISYFSVSPKISEVFSEYMTRCTSLLPNRKARITAWLVEGESSHEKNVGYPVGDADEDTNDCVLSFVTARNMEKTVWKKLRNCILTIPNEDFKRYSKNIDEDIRIEVPMLEKYLSDIEGERKHYSRIIIPAIYNKQLVALFAVFYDSADPLAFHRFYALAALTKHASPIIANARIRHITELRRQKLYALYKTSKQITHSYGLEQVLQTTIDGAVNTINDAEAGAIIIWQHYSDLVRCLKKARSGRYKFIEKSKQGTLDELMEFRWKNIVDRQIKSGLCVELVSRGLTLGALCLYNSHENKPFRDKETIQTFASLATEAIHNAMISEELHLLGLKVSQNDITVRDIFEKTVKSILKISTAKASNMLLLRDIENPDAAIQEVIQDSVAYGLGDKFDRDIKPRKKGVTQMVVRAGQPQTAYFPRINNALKKYNIRSYIGLPMNVQDKIIGVLFVHYEDHHRFKPSEIEMLSIFANAAAALIKNRLFIQQIENQSSRLQKLRQIVKETELKVERRLDKKKFLNWMSKRLADAFDSDRVLLLLFDSKNKEIICRGNHGYTKKFVKTLQFSEIEMGISGGVLKKEFIERGAAKTDNAAEDKRNIRLARIHAEKHKTGPLIVSPIWDKDQVVGTLTIGRILGSDRFTELDRNLAVMATSDLGKYIKMALT